LEAKIADFRFIFASFNKWGKMLNEWWISGRNQITARLRALIIREVKLTHNQFRLVGSLSKF